MSGILTPPGTQWLNANREAQRAEQEVGKQKFGPVKGVLHALGQYDQLARNGVRPFGPGEWLDRGGGNWSSEESHTVQMPNGQYAVVPGMWLVNGLPTYVSEDQAAQYARASGLTWPTFASEDEANAWAHQREMVWEQTPMGQSQRQPALWSMPDQPTGG